MRKYAYWLAFCLLSYHPDIYPARVHEIYNLIDCFFNKLSCVESNTEKQKIKKLEKLCEDIDMLSRWRDFLEPYKFSDNVVELERRSKLYELLGMLALDYKNDVNFPNFIKETLAQ